MAAEEIERWLLDEIDGGLAPADRFQVMIYFAVDSGMRWGELIGLQRKNLDLTIRRVSVVDQLVRTADGRFHRTEPKTSASVRSITISRMTAEVLGSHLGRHAGPGRDGLVFPTRRAIRWPSRAFTCTTSRRRRWRAVSSFAFMIMPMFVLCRCWWRGSCSGWVVAVVWSA